MHLGPQHAMVRPFLLDILVKGEGQEGLPRYRYIHKASRRSWRTELAAGITYTDRMCYVASLTNNECYCGAVEKILGLECQRGAVHSSSWRSSPDSEPLDRNGRVFNFNSRRRFAPWQYMIMDREKIISLIESVTGARLTHTLCALGRSQRPADGFSEQCRKVIPFMRSRTEEFIELFSQDPIYMPGWRISVPSPRDCQRMGCAGRVLRAAGVPTTCEERIIPGLSELDSDLRDKRRLC